MVESWWPLIVFDEDAEAAAFFDEAVLTSLASLEGPFSAAAAAVAA